MRTFIIAEAGVNHNGDRVIAKRLIDAAADAGADAVKFQTFSADRLVRRSAPRAAYQIVSTGDDISQYEMLKTLELDTAVFRELSQYCRMKNIMFLSTAFDLENIDVLHELGVPICKVPSGEITNLPYLRKIGGTGKKVILSTGMADLEEAGGALDVLIRAGTLRENITILHCNTEYPTPFEDVNLRAMITMRNTLNVKTGYSDHTPGIEVAVAAAALGAAVIEKHFTLDRNMHGPDHRASLEPHELSAMVRAIRHIEIAMGDGKKRPSPSEIKNRIVARRSIVAFMSIRKGEVFTEEMLTVKRPGSGISPMEWDRIIGLRASRDFEEDAFIEL